MGDVVNLRQFRKRKSREEKAATADANRKLHGISTKIKKQSEAENEIEARRLDGNKLSEDT